MNKNSKDNQNRLSAAIADGALVDITATPAVQDARAQMPTIALTQQVLVGASLWGDIRDIPPARAGIESLDARLYDTLIMTDTAMRGTTPARGAEVAETRIAEYVVAMTTIDYDPTKPATIECPLRAVIGADHSTTLVILRRDDEQTLSLVIDLYTD